MQADHNEYHQEIIIRIGHDQPGDQQTVEEKIETAIRKHSGHKE